MLAVIFAYTLIIIVPVALYDDFIARPRRER